MSIVTLITAIAAVGILLTLVSGMAMAEGRQSFQRTQAIALDADGTPYTREIPVNGFIKRILIRVSGSITHTGNNALTQDALKAILNRIELRGPNLPDPVSVTGPQLYHMLEVLRKVGGENTSLATGVASQPFAITFEVPLELVDKMAKERTYLSPVNAKNAELVVQRAPITDVVSGGNSSYDAGISADVTVVYAKDMKDGLRDFSQMQTFNQTGIGAGQNENRDIPVGPQYFGFLITARDSANLRSDDVIDRVEVWAEDKKLTDITWESLRSDLKSTRELNAAEFAETVGVAFLNADPDGEQDVWISSGLREFYFRFFGETGVSGASVEVTPYALLLQAGATRPGIPQAVA